ncbi:MAG: hypothetical protein VCD31_13315 [Alphaproteobacteria bacterium]
MDNLHFTFAVFALLFAALAAIAIWSRRKAPWKIAALGLVALILPLGYFAYIDLLAKPKPMRLEFRQLGETEVISAVLKEEEAIYLWLSVADEPRFYELPWDGATALELQTITRGAKARASACACRNCWKAHSRTSRKSARRENFTPCPTPRRRKNSERSKVRNGRCSAVP